MAKRYTSHTYDFDETPIRFDEDAQAFVADPDGEEENEEENEDEAAAALADPDPMYFAAAALEMREWSRAADERALLADADRRAQARHGQSWEHLALTDRAAAVTILTEAERRQRRQFEPPTARPAQPEPVHDDEGVVMLAERRARAAGKRLEDLGYSERLALLVEAERDQLRWLGD